MLPLRRGEAERARPLLPAFPWGLGSYAFSKKCSQEFRPQDGVSEGSEQARSALSLPLNSTKGAGPPQWSLWSLSGVVLPGPTCDVAFEEREAKISCPLLILQTWT